MTKSMPVLTTPTSAKLSALNAVRFRCGAGVIGFGGNGGGKGFDMMDGGLAWQTPRRDAPTPQAFVGWASSPAPARLPGKDTFKTN